MPTAKILELLKQIPAEFDEETPAYIKDIFLPKYSLSYKAASEFERLVNILQIYNFIYKYQGRTTTIVRPKVVQLLAFYVLQGGCNKASRKAAESAFNFDVKTVNSLNHVLRKAGYLIPNIRRSGDDRLNDDLEILRKCNQGQPSDILIQIKMSFWKR